MKIKNNNKTKQIQIYIFWNIQKQREKFCQEQKKFHWQPINNSKSFLNLRQEMDILVEEAYSITNKHHQQRSSSELITVQLSKLSNRKKQVYIFNWKRQKSHLKTRHQSNSEFLSSNFIGHESMNWNIQIFEKNASHNDYANLGNQDPPRQQSLRTSVISREGFQTRTSPASRIERNIITINKACKMGKPTDKEIYHKAMESTQWTSKKGKVQRSTDVQNTWIQAHKLDRKQFPAIGHQDSRFDVGMAISRTPMPQPHKRAGFPTEAQMDEKAFLGSECECWWYVQKMFTVAFSFQLYTIWELLPHRNCSYGDQRNYLLLVCLSLITPPPSSTLYNKHMESLSAEVTSERRGHLISAFPCTSVIYSFSHTLI